MALTIILSIWVVALVALAPWFMTRASKPARPKLPPGWLSAEEIYLEDHPEPTALERAHERPFHIFCTCPGCDLEGYHLVSELFYRPTDSYLLECRERSCTSCDTAWTEVVRGMSEWQRQWKITDLRKVKKS